MLTSILPDPRYKCLYYNLDAHVVQLGIHLVHHGKADVAAVPVTTQVAADGGGFGVGGDRPF